VYIILSKLAKSVKHLFKVKISVTNEVNKQNKYFHDEVQLIGWDRRPKEGEKRRYIKEHLLFKTFIP